MTIFVSIMGVCLMALIVVGITIATYPSPASDRSLSEEYDQPAAPTTPEPLTTKQPLVRFTANDYPCSDALYKIYYRIPEGAAVDTIGDSEPNTMKYCKAVKDAVDSLPTITSKVNHLVVEYCKLDLSQDGEEGDQAKSTNLDDIYGSLYGYLTVRYDKDADTYYTTWKQRSTNGDPAYFLGDQPSLTPLADKYCPEPKDTSQNSVY